MPADAMVTVSGGDMILVTLFIHGSRTQLRDSKLCV